MVFSASKAQDLQLTTTKNAELLNNQVVLVIDIMSPKKSHIHIHKIRVLNIMEILKLSG